MAPRALLVGSWLMAAAASAGRAGPPVAPQDEARTMAVQVCAACHGPEGRGLAPSIPRLAGQRRDYVEVQLKAFRDRSRADPMAQANMWAIAAGLSDAAIAQLAGYYAAIPPVAGRPGNAVKVEAGRKLAEEGVPAANIPSCLSCHGKETTGVPAFPRLSGQYAEYLVKQLAMFKADIRAGGSAPIMHGITSGLTFEQMEAAAAYFASLP